MSILNNSLIYILISIMMFYLMSI